MFERYTEKARRIIFFARYECSQFGASEIQTEHLLLGMLRENVATMSRHAGLELNMMQIRAELEKFVRKGTKLSTSVDLPISNECKRILGYAAEEAEQLGHRNIGTEHLLLGILREANCNAAQLLRQQGLKLDRVRKSIASDAASAAAGGGIGSGVGGDPAARITSRTGLALVELSPTEFQLTQHRGAEIPRIGEKISLQECGQESGQEAGEPVRSYRIDDIEWRFERSGAVSMLKSVKLKVSRLDETDGKPGSKLP